MTSCTLSNNKTNPRVSHINTMEEKRDNLICIVY